jgi:hypothetical protein
MECLELLKSSGELDASFDKKKSSSAKVYFEEIEELSEKPTREGKGFTFYNMNEADENGKHFDAHSIEVEANS